MGQFAVVNWERRRLTGLIAEWRGGGLRVHSEFGCDWPEQFDPSQSPSQAADLLRNCLPAGDFTPERVILSLSREDVILRHFDVPDVPESELPDLVRFQAAARSTVPIDQLQLDFLPLPKHASGVGRPVLVITASKPQVQGMQTVLRSVGWTPAMVTFGSLGLAECVCHLPAVDLPNPPRTVLGIARQGQQLEIVVLANHQPIFAHSARLPRDETSSPTALLSETNRAIVAAQRLDPRLKIEQAYFHDAGGQTEPVTAQLAERLGVPVHPLQLSALPGLTDYQGQASPMLIGLAYAESHRRTPSFDFLHPRQPPVEVSRRKLQLAVGAAAALLIFAVSAGAVELTRSSLQRQLEALEQENAELDVKIKPGQASLQAAKLIDQWQAGKLSQLDQLSSLEQLMEGTERMYLSQYAFAAGQGEAPSSLQATGNARSRDDVLQFQQRLMDTKHFSVQPRQLTQLSRDEDYPNLFELNATLLPKAAEKPGPKTGAAPTTGLQSPATPPPLTTPNSP